MAKEDKDEAMEHLARSYLSRLFDDKDKKFLKAFEVYSPYLPKQQQEEFLQSWWDRENLKTLSETQ
jgi:hypothetical protein